MEYENEPIGFLDAEKELPVMPDEVDVYLTCDNGHTYAYEIRAVID